MTKSFNSLVMALKLMNNEKKEEIYHENRFVIMNLPIEQVYTLSKLLDVYTNESIVNDYPPTPMLEYYVENECIQMIRYDITLEYGITSKRSPTVSAQVDIYGDAGGGPVYLGGVIRPINACITHELWHKLKFNTLTVADQAFLRDELTRSIKEWFTCKAFSYGEFKRVSDIKNDRAMIY